MPGHAGIGVVEPGGHDEAVEGDVALADDVDRAGLEVEVGDRRSRSGCRSPASTYCSLVARNSALEVGDLLAVDVGDAARAVGGVLVLGEDDDLAVGSGPLAAPAAPIPAAPPPTTTVLAAMPSPFAGPLAAATTLDGPATRSWTARPFTIGDIVDTFL